MRRSSSPSSFSSGGRTTSTGSVPGTPSAASVVDASDGSSVRSDSITYPQKRTGSLSARSSPSHAKPRVSRGSAAHSASRVVFPHPAGALTRVNRRGPSATRRSTSAGRDTRLRAPAGGLSLVASGTNGTAVVVTVAVTGAAIARRKRHESYRRSSRRAQFDSPPGDPGAAGDRDSRRPGGQGASPPRRRRRHRQGDQRRRIRGGAARRRLPRHGP